MVLKQQSCERRLNIRLFTVIVRSEWDMRWDFVHPSFRFFVLHVVLQSDSINHVTLLIHGSLKPQFIRQSQAYFLNNTGVQTQRAKAKGNKTQFKNASLHISEMFKFKEVLNLRLYSVLINICRRQKLKEHFILMPEWSLPTADS